jgi:6-phosphogluconolactonase
MSEVTIPGAVYVQTNDADRNEVLAFGRNTDGTLDSIGSYETGGRGSGAPHLPSQGSVVLAADGRRLLVANAGSDDVSVFAVAPTGLTLVDTIASGGKAPRSIAVSGSLVYVLNTVAPASLAGFMIEPDGKLASIEGSSRPLSAPDADPAQVEFSPDGRHLVVTERGTNSLSVYSIAEGGLLDDLRTIASSGATPYGFDFSPQGALVVTEAFGGAIGAAAASSYALGADGVSPVSHSVGNTRSEVCWAAVTPDGRYVYVTNFGDGTISSYALGSSGAIELLEPIAGTTVEGEKGVRDEALSSAGDFLYALDADARRIFGWSVASDGGLRAIGSVDVSPATVAGIAVS